jgi:hypothetical protein
VSTTARQIIDRVLELIDAVDELLATAGLKDLVREVAEALKVGDQINAVIDAILDALTTIATNIAKLEIPLRFVEALSGLTRLMAPLLDTLGEVMAAAEGDLKGLGLPDLNVGDALKTAMDKADTAVRAAGGWLDAQPPSAQQVLDLVARFGELGETLGEYKVVTP